MIALSSAAISSGSSKGAVRRPTVNVQRSGTTLPPVPPAMSPTVIEPLPTSVRAGIRWMRSCSASRARTARLAATMALRPRWGVEEWAASPCTVTSKPTPALVPVDGTARRGLGHDQLVRPQPPGVGPLPEGGGPRQPARLLPDRAHDQQRRLRPAALGLPGLEQGQGHAERRLGVDRAPAPHPVVLDPAVEGVVGHVLDGDGVGVDVEHGQPLAATREEGVDVGPAVAHVLQLHLAAEAAQPVGQGQRQLALAGRSGLRSRLGRVDAGDADEVTHPVGQAERVEGHVPSWHGWDRPVRAGRGRAVRAATR